MVQLLGTGRTMVDTDLRMTRQEYRSWVAAQPNGRFERVDGAVLRMEREPLAHANRKALAWLALRNAVAAAGLQCHVYADGMTVEVGESDFEPDVVVHCRERLPDDAIAVPDPLIILEVLRSGPCRVDTHEKLAAYFQLSTLRHYLVFWAVERRVVHFRRDGGGADIHTRIVTAGPIVLNPPGVTITVEEVYAG